METSNHDKDKIRKICDGKNYSEGYGNDEHVKAQQNTNGTFSVMFDRKPISGNNTKRKRKNVR